jgi:hypothetical protein
MFHSLRTLKSEPADKPELRFLETASDMPAAVQSWWYPADAQGYEFIYPREQALLLAKGSGRAVLTTEPTPGEAEVEYVRAHSCPR